MNKLSEIMKSPSGFDSLSNYIGEIPEDKWFCLLTQTRDSDCLTRSNFICALDLLGGEGDNVKVFRFGHWACGWWEALAISKSDEKAFRIANEIERKIEAYPVLNDDHFSEKEHEAKCDMVDDYLDSFLRNLNIETPYAQLKDDNRIRLWDACYDAIESPDDGVLEDKFFKALALGESKYTCDWDAMAKRQGQKLFKF